MATALPSYTERYSSQHVGDTFALRVHPAPRGGTAPVLVYLDAQLPTGKRTVPLAHALMAEGRLPQLHLLGIGQTNSLLRKRNRDFIPPRPGATGTPGQAAAFYRFLTAEALPWIETQVPVTAQPALIGHSLGGLFALYASLQEDSPFARFVALSPSVWVHRRRVLRIARARQDAGHQLRGRLFLGAGALEEFNLILPGMRAFARWIRETEAPDLALRVKEIPWKNHFTVVRPGVEQGLEWAFGDFD